MNIVLNDSLRQSRFIASVVIFIIWRSTVNLAKNYALKYNPIDLIEGIFSDKSYEFERRSGNEVVVEIEGKWNNMLLFFNWEENMRCLHLSCLMNIKTEIEDRSKVFELMALANEDLWLGHFSYWAEQNMPVFKHSLIIDDTDEFSIESKIAQVIEIAVKECERMYPAFNVVLTKGLSPQYALNPLSMAVAGQA